MTLDEGLLFQGYGQIGGFTVMVFEFGKQPQMGVEQIPEIVIVGKSGSRFQQMKDVDPFVFEVEGTGET